MTDEKIPPLKQMFSFEQSAVRLEDGSWFQPMRGAKCRWAVDWPAAYRIIGFNYEALYQLTDDSFVLVQFSAPEPMPESNARRPKIVLCNSEVEGKRIDVSAAVEFLVAGQFEIPESLQDVLRSISDRDRAPVPTPEPRPLDFWQNINPFASVQSSEKEWRVIDLLPKIRDASIGAVQEIRRWSTEEYPYRSHKLTINFAARLFDRYRVDPAKWWGPKKSVLPEDVDILQLQRPDGVDELKTKVIPELRKLVGNAATVLWANPPIASAEARPTEAEIRLAEEHLMQVLAAIEEQTVRLTTSLDELNSGEVSNRLLADGPKSMRPPTDNEMSAYFLRYVGKLQISEIKTKLKLAEHPGTISRWIDKARHWYERGNPLPDRILALLVDSRPKSKSVTSTDPSKLDLGPNREGRSPRQRNRQTDS